MTYQYREHLCVAGDRLDLLAWSYYGDACCLEPLLLANPELYRPQLPLALPAGLRLRIPYLEEVPASSSQGLTPWG